MSDESRLLPLTNEELARQLETIVEDVPWSMAVTLTTGDILFGDFLPTRIPFRDVGKKPYAYYPRSWDPPSDREWGTALWLGEIQLLFPSGDDAAGTPICRLDAGHVSAVWRLGWSLPAGVSALSGELARTIYDHNEAAAERANVQTFRLVSASTRVPRRVEVSGISFERNELLCVDYSYFQRLPTISYSLGAFGIGAGTSLSLSMVIDAVLANNLAKGLTLPSNTVRKHGFIAELHADQSVAMEGEEWKLLLFTEQRGVLNTERIPVLFKTSAVTYPHHLWRLIVSPLTIVGEERQIPIEIGDREWRDVITARAIAYVA